MSRLDTGLSAGDLVEIKITGLTRAGEGVGRWQGIVVFVPRAIPGERVRAEITVIRKDFTRGRLVEILNRSAARVEPGCRLFGDCGGCALLHMDYLEQLRWKTVQVRESLVRTGGLDQVSVSGTVGMDEPWHYRNKVHFHVGRVAGRLALGYFQRGSHQLVTDGDASGSPGCLLVQRDLLLVAGRAARILDTLRVPLYNWQEHRGYLRNLVLRRGAATGEIMLVLVTGAERWSGEAEFACRLVECTPAVVSVIRNINTRKSREILGRKNRVRAGKPFIIERLGGCDFQLGPTSFFQVNPEQAARLFEIVARFAGLTGRETVVDAYSGIGTIALLLASRARAVIGLESLELAVADAWENARRNRIKNVRFEQGAVEELLPALAGNGEKVDVVILDPPRRGCAPAVLNALARLRPGRVIYLSCDPATLARDLGRLSNLGFRVLQVQPVDMFPQTHHVETLVGLRRLNS